ncbi:unnamed protein product [Discosporangium mesarthrocarpum]
MMSSGARSWFPNMVMAMTTAPTRGRPKQAAFRVPPKMTKWEVKEYLWKIYNVPVKKVTTQNFEGKRKRLQGKRRVYAYKRPDYKKAIVTLDLERMGKLSGSYSSPL